MVPPSNCIKAMIKVGLLVIHHQIEHPTINTMSIDPSFVPILPPVQPSMMGIEGS